MPTPKTIAVAMSGGVDSSTVAAMLRAEGHEVVGLTMQLWNQRRLAGHEGMPESVQGRCCSLDDVYDAAIAPAQPALCVPRHLAVAPKGRLAAIGPPTVATRPSAALHGTYVSAGSATDIHASCEQLPA